MSKLALALTYSQALSHVLSQRTVLVQVGLPCVVARARLCLCCGGEAVGGGSNNAVFKPSPYGIHIYTVRTSNVCGREGRILSTSVPQNHQDKVGFRMRDLIREWKRERERERVYQRKPSETVNREEKHLLMEARGISPTMS